MTTQKKVDIFKLLKELNSRDTSMYQELSSDDKKTVAPFVLMKWMASVNDPERLMLLDIMVNQYVFSFSKDKDLMMELLSGTGSGKYTKFHWRAGKKQTNFPKSIRVIKEYYGYSTEDAKSALPLLSNDDIYEIAESLGYQPNELSDIKKEFKKR